MIFSYNWLQRYFEKPLPVPEKLAELLTMHIAEVEGIEEKTIQTEAEADEGGAIQKRVDYAIDVKILPDRGCYGYGHLYLAREINAFTDCGFKNNVIAYTNIDTQGSPQIAEDIRDEYQVPKITIEDPNKVPVFTARIYRDIENKKTPLWMKNYLEVVGQRSISFIVDLTNFVMMDIGQPMHAFDLDKIEGDIFIRYGKEGEVITLLDGREVALDSSILVIADQAGPLDIAGIKGGKKAEVTSETKNIILTAGNFEAAYIRKTSQKVGIKNDASKRYENAVTRERVFEAQEAARCILIESTTKQDTLVTYGILSIQGDSIANLVAIQASRIIEVPISFVGQKIGRPFSLKDIQDILHKVQIESKISDRDANILVVLPPVYRSDLVLKEDIVEEIGRLHGYHTLKSVVPDKDSDVDVLPSFYFSNLIRATLVSQGYNEIYTHSLVDSGDIPLANPLSADRSHMRNDLMGEMQKVLIKNIQHLDLLSPTDTKVTTGDFTSEVSKYIKVFEIGHVFKDGQEKTSLAIGVAMKDIKNARLELEKCLDDSIGELSDILACDIGSHVLNKEEKQIPPTGGLVPCILASISIDLQEILSKVGASAQKGVYPLSKLGADDFKMGQYSYKPMSEYPYIVRDVAVFVPGPKGNAESVRKTIASINDPLLVSIRQFDQFEKTAKQEDGTSGSVSVEKTSYAFRLVFQSYTETLTEAIVQEKMETILNNLKNQEGWEIR